MSYIDAASIFVNRFLIIFWFYSNVAKKIDFLCENLALELICKMRLADIRVSFTLKASCVDFSDRNAAPIDGLFAAI